MKKVLIIAYSFHRKHSIASVRQNGIAKYLPIHGWEPIIVTPAMPDRASSTLNSNVRLIETPYCSVLATWRKRLGFNPDRGIQHQLGTADSNNTSSNLINRFSKFLKIIIAYPDAQKGWYPFAAKAAEEFLQKERVDAIISSSSPVTSHLIARHLKTRFNIPWVADFRDLWTQNHYFSHNFIRKIVEKRLELTTLSPANVLVTVSNPWAEDLKKLHQGKTVHCIPNGFDPDELVELPMELTKKFTITYCGNLYAGKRNPSLLFEVLNKLIVDGNIDPNDIQVRFYGRDKDWLQDKINLYGLQNVVKHYGNISREMVLKKQKESHVLLLLKWDTTNPGEKGMCPAKLFEYLAAKRPILAFGGPSGVVAEILNETEAGTHISSSEDLRKLILQYYREYKETGSLDYKCTNDKIMKYSHTEMAEKFAHVLSTVIQNSD